MTLCESLFNKDSRKPFMIFCLESIYNHANIPIDPTTQAGFFRKYYSHFFNISYVINVFLKKLLN